MDYLDAVKSYYETEGILSTSFTCELKGACATSGSDSGPKSAHVGSRYGLGVPRMLFVSLDAGWADPSAEERTPEAVRENTERVGIKDSAPNTHWYRTCELAREILSQFKQELRQTCLGDITPYFAHTNASKCCPSGSGGNASSVAYLNCHRYLKREVSVLDPDVLVTQGREAEVSLRALLTDEVNKMPNVRDAEVAKLCGRRRFLLYTYHPRYARGFYDQRRQSGIWSTYAEAIRRFYDSIPKAC